MNTLYPEQKQQIQLCRVRDTDRAGCPQPRHRALLGTGLCQDTGLSVQAGDVTAFVKLRGQRSVQSEESSQEKFFKLNILWQRSKFDDSETSHRFGFASLFGLEKDIILRSFGAFTSDAT